MSNTKTALAKPIHILIRAAGLASLAGVAYVVVKADRWLHAAYPVKPGPGTHMEYATRLTHALGQNMKLQAEDMRQKKQRNNSNSTRNGTEPGSRYSVILASTAN